MWQSPPFPNYGEPFIYSYKLLHEGIKIKSARGKLAVFPPIKNGELFVELYVNGIFRNYTPDYYIDENLRGLYATYKPLFDGDLLYVLGVEINGNRQYFDTSFLVSTKSALYPYSVLGLEENNAQYNGFSLYGQIFRQPVLVPKDSFVLSSPEDTSLSLRYEFGEEEIYNFDTINLIVKKPISYTIIPSLPKVKLPNKGILELHFK